MRYTTYTNTYNCNTPALCNLSHNPNHEHTNFYLEVPVNHIEDFMKTLGKHDLTIRGRNVSLEIKEDVLLLSVNESTEKFDYLICDKNYIFITKGGFIGRLSTIMQEIYKNN